MQSQQRPTRPPFSPIPLDGSQKVSPCTAPLVAVVLKEHRDYNGAPKTWWCAPIAHVAIVTGRLPLRREGYGIVFDVPYAEVARVSIGDQETLVPRVHPSPLRPG